MLLLSTPIQYTRENSGADLNPKSLKQWINKLPTNDVIQTVQLLHSKLAPFNETEMDKSLRFKLLEVYRIAFEEFLYLYDHLRLRQLPIQASQRKSLSEDVMWLYLSLATGYKIIIKECMNNKSIIERPGIRMRSAYRAMELIIHALIYATKAQQAAPPLACLEINQLYLMSETQNKLQYKIRTGYSHQRIGNIDRLYKQFLLLLLSNPQNLAFGEIYEYYMLLDNYASHLNIISPQERSSATSSYYVDLMEDDTIKFDPDISNKPASETLRFIDPQPVINLIKSHLNKSSNRSKQSFGVNQAQLLNIIFKNMNSPGNNMSFNAMTNIPANLICGAMQVNHFLANPKDLDYAITTKLDSRSGIVVDNVNTNTTPIKHIPYCTIIKSSDLQRTVLLKLSDKQRLPRTDDISAVLMLNNGKAHQSLELCIIQSAYQEDKHTAKLELLMLHGEATPIHYSLTPENDSELTKQGWLFYINENINSILIESDSYFKGSRLYVKYGADQLELTQTDLIAQTTKFANVKVDVITPL